MDDEGLRLSCQLHLALTGNFLQLLRPPLLPPHAEVQTLTQTHSLPWPGPPLFCQCGVSLLCPCPRAEISFFLYVSWACILHLTPPPPPCPLSNLYFHIVMRKICYPASLSLLSKVSFLKNLAFSTSCTASATAANEHTGALFAPFTTLLHQE